MVNGLAVLVCGGRTWGCVREDFSSLAESEREIERDRAREQQRHLREVLNELFRPVPAIALVIEGGAQGADIFARAWATWHMVKTKTFRADWKTHGKAAGHIRNAQMLREGKPDLVLAFPGGRGTVDMVRKARAAGVPVRACCERHPLP